MMTSLLVNGSKMADNDSSKLRAQIAFLTNLIKSHKNVPQSGQKHSNVPGTKAVIRNTHTAFSWQRKSQPDTVKKRTLSASRQSSVPFYGQTAANKVWLALKSSHSLDRRKGISSSSGSSSAVPGSSGTNAFKASKNEVRATRTTWSCRSSNPHFTTLAIRNTPALVKVSEAAVSSGVSQLPNASSTTVLPRSSSFSSLVNSKSLTRNPYVVIKKGMPSVSDTRTVAKKSDLKWTRPGNSTLSTAEDVNSHSDSELYTKKSSISSAKQFSGLYSSGGKALLSSAQSKMLSTSNIQPSSLKWSRTPTNAATNLAVQRDATTTKFANSNLKWNQTGVHHARFKGKTNPYVLERSTGFHGKPTQKSKAMLSKSAKTTKAPLYSFRSQMSNAWATGKLSKSNRQNSTWSSVQAKTKLNSFGGQMSSGGFMERRQRAVLGEIPRTVTRYSIVRQKRRNSQTRHQKTNKVVFIAGIPYQSTTNKLKKARTSCSGIDNKKVGHASAGKVGKLTKTVHLHGEKFVMDSKGKSLQRISNASSSVPSSQPGPSNERRVSSGRRDLPSGRHVTVKGVTYLQSKPTTLIRSKTLNTQRKAFASRALRRSIQNARLSKTNKKKTAAQQYCMFYNRFGKCNKRETCPYIHDPTKIAVCTKFLRGCCKNTDGSCPFSHKIDPSKMPVCQFFLQGKCFNENCPYSHVNVSKKAEVCEDFLKGFCSKGQQCTKKHILECEEFLQTGQCSKGKNCKLIHRTRKDSNIKRRNSSTGQSSTAKLTRLDFTSDEGFLPLTDTTDQERNLRQESIDSKSSEIEEMAVEPVVIRPRFLKTKESEK